MDKQMSRLWQRVDPAARAAFFSCFMVGYLAHLFAFANLIPNADGLSRVYDPQQMTVSGRWFLHYASALNDFTQMPAAIGLVTMVLLGLAAALTVDILKIRGRVAAGLWGAIMAAFPCLGYTFLYMFTASAYALAILLAAGSVWLARRGDKWSLLGPVLLALAMGIYQAYVTVAIGPCPAGSAAGDAGALRHLSEDYAPGGAVCGPPGGGGHSLLCHFDGVSKSEGPGAAVLSGHGRGQLRLSHRPAAPAHLLCLLADGPPSSSSPARPTPLPPAG